ncbi:cobalt-precorrin-6A reductase [Salaquimonas pukyongi]|uniref:cobalt-precorrin-6A reductase n=1 Tax=Salaquimonas pukyongi TaxID=2712698 RepID=UPI001FCDA26D|nr:cobalt-precorrin-6A reductase [Salaquimonas pukyongi]
MARKDKILILGGTQEAVELADELAAKGHDVTTSLAGRTREPRPVTGSVRIGGFSGDGTTGAEGLAAFLIENGFTRLIDATHPFAANISANARQAAQTTGVIFENRQRAPWRKLDGETWIKVASLEEARDTIPPGARVLLALGSQHIASFAARKDVHFVLRMIDKPAEPLPFERYDLVLGRPADNTAAETMLLKSHDITHIVSRNSGGKGAYAKITAARELGIPVIMIGRPVQQEKTHEP